MIKRNCIIDKQNEELYLNEHDEYHRVGGPAITRWYENGQKRWERYFINGKSHREDGPAFQYWYEDGTLAIEEYFHNDKYHRVDGPAHIVWYSSGQKSTEVYYSNGIFHREDGPAKREWYEDGRVKREEYYLNGFCSRTDGPAIIRFWLKNNEEEFLIHGVRVLPEWFIKLGKDINKDFTDDAVRDMIINIYLNK